MANPDPKNPIPDPVPEPKSEPKPTPAPNPTPAPSNGFLYMTFTVALVALLAGAFATGSIFSLGSRVTDVESVANKAVKGVDSLRTVTTVLRAGHEFLAEEMGKLKGRMTNAEKTVSGVTSRVDSVSSAHSKSIAGLYLRANTNSTALGALNARVGNAEQKVETLEKAPALFTADQLARLRTYADTLAAPATPSPAAPATK